MKGTRVIIPRENEARTKRIKEIEESINNRFYSTFQLDQIREELNRDYPEYVYEDEGVILANDTTKAVVETSKDHILHIVDLEGLKVIHDEEDNIR